MASRSQAPGPRGPLQSRLPLRGRHPNTALDNSSANQTDTDGRRTSSQLRGSDHQAEPDGPAGQIFSLQGSAIFNTRNTSLNDLISYSYKIHNDQIIGAPGWAGTEKYDIDAEPDGEGMPNDQQWKDMMQKLLAERFALTSHHDKKELPVYVLCGRQERAKT